MNKSDGKCLTLIINAAILTLKVRRPMLTKGRQKIILRVLQERGSVTVSELTALLDSSESTIRRDLHAMDSEGLLNKVHGGATATL